MKRTPKRTLSYSFAETAYGLLLLGATEVGLSFVGFVDEGADEELLRDMQKRFPQLTTVQAGSSFHEVFLSWLADQSLPKNIPLDIYGTDFQRRVWDALLKLPTGQQTTYGALAKSIGAPKAARAIGGAVGRNPIAVYIPCHRVLASSGSLGGYHWGVERKKMLLEAEHTQSI